MEKNLFKYYAWTVLLDTVRLRNVDYGKQRQVEASEMCIWRRTEMIKWADELVTGIYAGTEKVNEKNHSKEERATN